MALDDIETIIFVMLENRSFDHMLGYLSLDETEAGLPVDGLRSNTAWLSRYANKSRGAEYPIRRIPGSQAIRQDPPHGRESIAEQIRMAPRGPGVDRMGGFVESYVKAHRRVDDPGVVMGYHDAVDLPSYDFLARNFCVCDRWFSSVPLGTQANRLMAMAGESRVLDNVGALPGLPEQQLVYDWLEERRVPWRVYVSGGYAPFFMLMPHWRLPMALSLARSNGPFRRFSKFATDWREAREMPSVIFIEPEYADAPMSDPNDDHPPASIHKGQEFIDRIYRIVTSNEARWRRTLMIITYDEHGGFFDHVPPPAINTVVNGVTLPTLGPRVPALLVSPFVRPGQLFNGRLDHTSFLQLLADRFGAGLFGERYGAAGRFPKDRRCAGGRSARRAATVHASARAEARHNDQGGGEADGAQHAERGRHGRDLPRARAAAPGRRGRAGLERGEVLPGHERAAAARARGQPGRCRRALTRQVEATVVPAQVHSSALIRVGARDASRA